MKSPSAHPTPELRGAVSRSLRRLVRCWWRGHDETPSLITDDWECRECGKLLDYHAVVTNDGGVRGRIRALWQYVTNWWRPCEDCGSRFGRHDETKDHIPF